MNSPLKDSSIDYAIEQMLNEHDSMTQGSLADQRRPRTIVAPVSKAKKRMSANYSPSLYSVMIGRGKVFTEAVGTRRLKVIASCFLAEYSAAKSQVDKASIITKIVHIVQEACPVGAFLKYEEGSWWEVSDNAAREKVGVVLRDLLHDQYKSSTKARSASRSKSRKLPEKGPTNIQI